MHYAIYVDNPGVSTILVTRTILVCTILLCTILLYTILVCTILLPTCGHCGAFLNFPAEKMGKSHM